MLPQLLVRSLGKAVSEIIRQEENFIYFPKAFPASFLCAMYCEGIRETEMSKTPPDYKRGCWVL